MAAATPSSSHRPPGRGGKKTWVRTRRRRKYVNDVAATLGRATVADCNTVVAAADGRWSARAKIIKSKPTTTNPFRAPRTTTTTTAMRPPARPRSCRRRPRSSISARRRARAELYFFNYIIEYYYIICLKIILTADRFLASTVRNVYRTINNMVFFTIYTPHTPTLHHACILSYCFYDVANPIKF